MNAPHVGEASIELPWLAPCAASLVTLARAPTAAWQHLRHDPAAVLLLVRQSSADHLLSPLGTLQTADVLQSALDLLGQPGFIDRRNPALHRVFHAAQQQARLAQGLARRIEGCDSQRAWIGGLLAPLGWLAIAAVGPAEVGACLDGPHFNLDPAESQRRLWGVDHTAIARRLSRRWNLPTWLGTIAGHLALPADIAQALGAERKTFQVVQLAVELVNQRGKGLLLSVASTLQDLRDALGLSQEEVDQVWSETEPLEPSPPHSWDAPAQCPLLADLLHMAIAGRRHSDHVLVERLQHDLDALQRALETQCGSENARLHAKKLAALAELAAGAGHEINNPLAVISGQAQYLLGREADPDRRKSLQTIVSQAQRIHQILVDLMQFARPTTPQHQHVELGGLVRGVLEMLEPLAQERQVRLVGPESLAGYAIHADPGQVRQALTCLLRNAIEAAPAGGWAGLRLQPADGQGLDLYVEDNGPGPSPTAVEHLFDPFYSGRIAGRGRGLGLTTAWRLARQNQGDVDYAGHDAGVTRFVLHLQQAHLQPPEAPTNGEHLPTNGTPIIVSSSW